MTGTWRSGRRLSCVAALAMVLAACATGPDGHRAEGAGTTPGRPASPTGSTEPAPTLPPHLRRWLVVPPGSAMAAPRPGTVVRVRRADPVGRRTADSLGLWLERGRDELWVLAVVDEHGLHVASELPGRSAWLTFGQWLADTAGVEAGGPGLVLADVRPGGRMVPVAPGAVVLDQAVVPDGRLGPFRERSTSVASVAIVRWQGSRWYVLGERRGAGSRRNTVAAGRAGFAASTAEQLITEWERAGRRP